ncbi:hypothetical protein ONA92_18280 [Mycobacteroides salmoniphilum]|uniref:hypothetical protein n=1 Tax=Mycobacteroides salmoniphilum TaxID=404941 RepID=UPI003566B05B
MRREAVTAELIADMRKAAETLERATYAYGPPDPGGYIEWRPLDLRRAADELARELAKNLPAMLMSLDCDAARGGTVWRDSSMPGHWLYRYSEDQWWWKPPYARSWQPFRTHTPEKLRLFLSSCGPYVAVGQSAGEGH